MVREQVMCDLLSFDKTAIRVRDDLRTDALATHPFIGLLGVMFSLAGDCSL